MNYKNKNGGSAFPVMHTIDGNWQKDPIKEHSGMSLRDYFAAHALHSYILAQKEMNHFPDHARIAIWSYETADAMIEEREVK